MRMTGWGTTRPSVSVTVRWPAALMHASYAPQLMAFRLSQTPETPTSPPEPRYVRQSMPRISLPGASGSDAARVGGTAFCATLQAT